MISTKSAALILVIVVVSFLGFCVENVFISFSHGFVDNRNMVLPFLFGYGLSILAYYHLFGTPDNPLYFSKEFSFPCSNLATIYCFIVAFLGVSIGEIILGYLTEWSVGIIWWNYSAIPLHITRYTSVPTSFCFALTFFKGNVSVDRFLLRPAGTKAVLHQFLKALVALSFTGFSYVG